MERETDESPEPAATPAAGRRVEKSAAAFRTISEVADDLDVPQHVLRFWETKFTQVKPLKRGGGRRYYRPEDVELLRSIRGLLYDEGYTIKGVQRLMREGGLKTRAEAPPDGVPPAAAPGPGPSTPAGKPPAPQLDLGLGMPLDPERRRALQTVIEELSDMRRRLDRALG
ncbi:MAG: MerR family transcriptional regulator [Dongiaceae bacterium]